MLFLWFDHPLIEAWLERRLAAFSPNYFPRRRGFGASGASSRYSTGTTFYEGSFVKPSIVGT